MPKIYSLNPQEVGDALTEYIGRQYESAIFFPYRIVKMKGQLTPNLGNIDIELEFIPKGTKIGDAKHVLP